MVVFLRLTDIFSLSLYTFMFRNVNTGQRLIRNNLPICWENKKHEKNQFSVLYLNVMLKMFQYITLVRNKLTKERLE